MKRFLLRLGDYVFVMRPLILIPAWSFYLLGAAAGRSLAPAGSAPAELYYGFGSLSAILVTAYLLNQVFDQESDERNEKGHYLTRGIFRARTVVLMAMVSFLAASYFFRNAAPYQRPPLVLALVLSLVYSLPPIRLVARPIVDLVANAVGYGGIAYVTGFWASAPSRVEALLTSLPYAMLVGAAFLHTTILDVEGDRASGKFTTTVMIGIRNSAVAAVLLAAAGLWCAVWLSFARYGEWLPPLLLAVGVVVFAVSAVRILRHDSPAPAASSNAVQAATVLVTLPAIALWPLYAALVIPIAAAARFYYRSRFGISYPGVARRS